MEKEKISIIIPIYNVKEYLKKSIQSVINQTYKNIQIILVDDGSTDGSSDICDLFAKIDSRIEVYHKTNSGVADARNYGIEKASGDYIIFLDSDDWIDTDFCNILVDAAIKNDADLVVCNHKDIGVNFEAPANLIQEKRVVENREEFIIDYIENAFYVYVVWGKLYRRDIIRNIQFKKMKIGEDTCFMLDVFGKVNKSVFLPYVGYNYLCREGAITKIQKFGDKDIDRIRIAAYFMEICYKSYPQYYNKAKEMLFYRTSKELFRLYKKEDINACKYFSNIIINIVDLQEVKHANIGRKYKFMLILPYYSNYVSKLYTKIMRNL